MPPMLEAHAQRKFFKSKRPVSRIVICNIASAFNDYEVFSQGELLKVITTASVAASARNRKVEILIIDKFDLVGPSNASFAVQHKALRSKVSREVNLVFGSDVYSNMKQEDSEAATSFSEVQLRLMAHAGNCFVALHGGANYVTLYFGRPTVLYHPSGFAVDQTHGIQFAAALPLLGGSRIVAVSNSSSMADAAAELVHTGACDDTTHATN